MGEFTRKSIKELFLQQPGSEVIVKGWVRTKRGNKNVSFIALNDGSTIRNMQVVCAGDKFTEDQLKDVTTGACLCVRLLPPRMPKVIRWFRKSAFTLKANSIAETAQPNTMRRISVPSVPPTIRSWQTWESISSTTAI